MPAQGLGEYVRRVAASVAAFFHRTVIIVLELRPEIRVCDRDDSLRALPGRAVAQVGDALLRDDNLHVVLRGVDVRAEGDDAGELAALRGGESEENGEVGVVEKSHEPPMPLIIRLPMTCEELMLP